MRPEVKLEGFAELSKALKAAGDGAEKEFREELKNSSTMFAITADARRRQAAATGRNLKRPSRSTGQSAAAVRVSATAKGVYLIGGKASVPYYGWVEFGGALKPSGRRHNTQRRDFIKRGRSLYPAIEQHKPAIKGVALDAMENIKQKAGLHG